MAATRKVFRLASIFVALGFFVAMWLACVPAPAIADQLTDAADNWVDQRADKDADGILRKVTDKIDLDKDVQNGIKNALKKAIKSQLKDALLPQTPSLAMQEIIDRIKDALNNGTRRNRCDQAAVNQAWWAANNVNRTVRGMAWTFVDTLESAIGAEKIVKELGESALKFVTQKVKDKIKEYLQNAVDEYLKNFKIETFSERFDTGTCQMIMQIIWNKGQGRFYYAIIGDCNCARVPCGDGRTIALGRWSIDGEGNAKWVGEAAEKSDARRLVPVSAIKRVVDRRGREHAALSVGPLRVKAVCCRLDGPLCGTAGDPWVFTGPQTPVTPRGAKPVRPRPSAPVAPPKTPSAGVGSPTPEPPPRVPTNPVSGEPLGRGDTEIEIPEIPAGPLCSEERQKILDKAGEAFRRARDRVQRAERDYESASESNREELKKRLDAANALEEKAGEALDKANQIPEKKNCDKLPAAGSGQHSMVIPRFEESMKSRAHPTALAMRASGPPSCGTDKTCRYDLTITNLGAVSLTGAWPIVMRTNVGVRAVAAHDKTWTCSAQGTEALCFSDRLALAPEQHIALSMNVTFDDLPGSRMVKTCFATLPRPSDDEAAGPDDRISVRLLQLALQNAGYAPGPIDGRMGTHTSRAMHAYAETLCPTPTPLVLQELLVDLLGGEIAYGKADSACITTRLVGRTPRLEPRPRHERAAPPQERGPDIRPLIDLGIGIGLDYLHRRGRHREDGHENHRERD